jgi:hypothetical protein
MEEVIGSPECFRDDILHTSGPILSDFFCS